MPTRLKFPKYRAPGSNEFQQVSWDFALGRIATLMKQDRDANFVARNAAGTTVNRMDQHRHAGSVRVLEVETAYFDVEDRARAFGMLVFDNQARGPTRDRRWPVWLQHSVAAQ